MITTCLMLWSPRTENRAGRPFGLRAGIGLAVASTCPPSTSSATRAIISQTRLPPPPVLGLHVRPRFTGVSGKSSTPRERCVASARSLWPPVFGPNRPRFRPLSAPREQARRVTTPGRTAAAHAACPPPTPGRAARRLETPDERPVRLGSARQRRRHGMRPASVRGRSQPTRRHRKQPPLQLDRLRRQLVKCL